MNARRILHTALVLPLAVAASSAALVLGGGTAAAAAPTHAASAAPAAAGVATSGAATSSSRKHKHERVTCHPGHIDREGHCRVTFHDKLTEGDSSGQRVCFSVAPEGAGRVETGSGRCTTTNGAGNAFATFEANSHYCGPLIITATERGESGGQAHHTVVRIECAKTATTAGASVPSIPTGSGSGLAMGGAALALLGSTFGLRVPRFVVSWRPATTPA